MCCQLTSAADRRSDLCRRFPDRFAQFFVAPLCLKSAVDRELNAVNNEHEKNLQSDYWRMAQLSESALNPDHPIARFSTGNFVTLRDEPKAKGIDIRERLLTFYHAHYSANLVSLCNDRSRVAVAPGGLVAIWRTLCAI
jgi:secreted Zn-dependent insulinase-like peptidase